MTRVATLPSSGAQEPAIRRLAALAPLDAPALAALDRAARLSRHARPSREIVAEGAAVTEPLLILDGWAARVRILEDGRRQIINLLLPGDLIGICRQPRPLASSATVALTNVTFCAAPPLGTYPALDEAYAVSEALAEAHLVAQITRLGRMTAEERIADLLLELRDRLALGGLMVDDGFLAPLTQEVLGDVTGLTAVHVNRMVQQLRKQGDIAWKAGRLTLVNAAGLAHRVGRSPIRVTETGPQA